MVGYKSMIGYKPMVAQKASKSVFSTPSILTIHSVAIAGLFVLAIISIVLHFIPKGHHHHDEHHEHHKAEYYKGELVGELASYKPENKTTSAPSTTSTSAPPTTTSAPLPQGAAIIKTGNNSTVSCQQFCQGNWGGVSTSGCQYGVNYSVPSGQPAQVIGCSQTGSGINDWSCVCNYP